jgi:hypothetical protein
MGMLFNNKFVDLVFQAYSNTEKDRTKSVLMFCLSNLVCSKKYPFAEYILRNRMMLDTIISDICKLIIGIVGDVDKIPEVSTNIKDEIINFYSSIWCCNAAEQGGKQTGANAAIKGLIKDIVNSNTILNIAKSGLVIPDHLFNDFAQMACGCMLGHYVSIEEFKYMFIIKTTPAELKIPKANMVVLDRKTLIGFISTPASVLSSNIYFSELPTTYGENPARATRPMLTLKQLK